MKIKSLLTLFSVLFFLNFISCDDDLNSIGGSIQPPSDTISVMVDTIALKSRTISMQDSVYARTIYGVLGQYEDKLFGTIKSDYLCQFMFPKEAKFEDNLIGIDSVRFVIGFYDFQGDSLAPMGLTVYEVDKKLPEYFYTNVDPHKYVDMSKILVHQAYTVKGTEYAQGSSTIREITADLGIPFGKSVYDFWKSGKIEDDSNAFIDFFPGMYVTTTSGTGNLINTLDNSFRIYYKYNHIKGNHDGTQDTIRAKEFSLSVTPEVIQLNQVKNKNPEELFVEGTGATYLKTPAGVFTEVVFPISRIAENMKDKNMSTINSAQFSVKGYTEWEDDSDLILQRPNYLLLIPKDSIDSFFKKGELPYSYEVKKKNEHVLMATRAAGSNVYSFGNISPLIMKYKNENVDNINYVILPVQTEYSYTSSGSTELVKVYNYLAPSTAILRNDPTNMRLELVYSKF